MTRVCRTQAQLDEALGDTGSFEPIELAEGIFTLRKYGSATVEAYGSATVRAYGSATVRAYGSATVRAYGSATVRAYGSATVRAYDSATVEAYDSATVRAYDSATVRASKYVAVHRPKGTYQKSQVTGGVLIEAPDPQDITDPGEWADYYGVDTVDGKLTVYKGVDQGLISSRSTAYPVGETVEAPDWSTVRECGGGLHFSPTPHRTHAYVSPQRYLACEVDIAEVVCLGDKIKARACRVLHEVDVDGERVDAPAEARS